MRTSTIRSAMFTLALCAGTGFAVAQEATPTQDAKPNATATSTATPTTAPAAMRLPVAPMATPELEAAALAAFEAKDYARALPLLQDLAVRLRSAPDRVAPILEKVRIAEANVGEGASALVEGINAPRTPHPKPAAGAAYEVKLEKLGNFNYDAERGGNIPDDVKALAGATLKLRGFMIPIDEANQITKFVLVPSLFACCFGQPPAIQHTVVVTLPEGKSVPYLAEELNVIGTLRVEEKREDGFITSIFEVTPTSIRPAQ